jgi:hypothetical protein
LGNSVWDLPEGLKSKKKGKEEDLNFFHTAVLI